MQTSPTYNLIFKAEPEGGFTVTVPSLPGCVSYGKDLSDATRMAQDAIAGYIESLKKHHKQIPSNDRPVIKKIENKTKLAPGRLVYA